MGLRLDADEFERLHKLTPSEANVVTEFDIGIRADRDIAGAEVVALLGQRFPWFALSAPRIRHPQEVGGE